MLDRLGRQLGEPQRGVVIHDESTIERNVQAWTQRWRAVAGRIPGTLRHIVDAPFSQTQERAESFKAPTS